MSFVNATLVLSIGETVEEVTDSGFLGTTPTLACAQIGDDALVQVNILFLQLCYFSKCLISTYYIFQHKSQSGFLELKCLFSAIFAGKSISL